MHLYRALREGNLWLSGNKVQYVKHHVSNFSAFCVQLVELLRWSGGSVLAFGTQVHGFAPG
jgi:hypothetical protein